MTKLVSYVKRLYVLLLHVHNVYVFISHALRRKVLTR